MELFLDVLGESLVDTAKMLPFLFLAYLFIEYVETRHGERIETLLAGGGRWGAIPGAVLDGRKAVREKLIDELGGLSEALQWLYGEIERK